LDELLPYPKSVPSFAHAALFSVGVFYLHGDIPSSIIVICTTIILLPHIFEWKTNPVGTFLAFVYVALDAWVSFV